MESRNIRSFGRIKSRKLSENKILKLKEVLPKYSITIAEDKVYNLPNNSNSVFFEIGFGYGEHTVHQAILNKNTNIIACETYINGILSILNKIEENNINNIKIYNGDARLLLEKLPDNFLDKIFILFPDPWPKKKQNKRRIINSEFIELIKKKLKINGTLFFASDILSYVESVYDTLKNKMVPNFDNLQNCKKEPAWWIKTRYQEKAIREGRESYFMEYINNS